MRTMFLARICFCVAVGFSAFALASPAASPNIAATAKKVPSNKNAYNLVLYTSPRCPYCLKVTDYLKEHEKIIPTKNVQDPEIRGELVRIGGKAQVPCLVINGQALYESNDIISWLKTHL